MTKILNKNTSRKYTFDYAFFEKINSEEKAYWLGFIYADGSHDEYHHRLTIALAEEDKGHLSKFAYSTRCDSPISTTTLIPRTTNSQLIYKISVVHPYTSLDLVRLGCPQTKTFKLKFPTEDQVPINLIKHFIRGYFDGDGSICWKTSKKTNNRPSCYISFVGTKDFIEVLCKLFLLKFGLKISIIDTSNINIKTFSIGGNRNVEPVLDWLYKDATVFLERKYKKYKQLKELNSIPILTVVQKNKNGEVVREWDGCKSAATHYNINQNAISCSLNKKRTYRGFLWESYRQPFEDIFKHE